MEITIYHNPKCSKSRQTKQLLEERGVQPRVILYLENPPSASELETFMNQLGGKGAELVRFKEERARELKLSQSDSRSNAEWARLLAANPQLIERPIVVKGDQARLGRPPENILPLLEAL